MLMLIETALVLFAIVLSLSVPRLGSRWFERLEVGFCRVSRKPTLSILIVVMSALAARAVVLPILPVPTPQVDDEYSHLLLADTLLHGRLANPTHPMWVHFETVEAIMRPTYASVYQPTQGMFLAIGRVLTGQPFVGVMLSVAVMCGAICWMLQGYLPPGWAFLGGLLAVTRYGLFTYWADSFMGGAPAAIGGALVMGALVRVRRDFRAFHAVILGIGFAVLANSRPYEGFVLSFLAGVSLLIYLLTDRMLTWRRVFAHFIAPLAIVVVLAGSATGYYFWRTTGNPLRAPYQVIWQTYGMVPKFVWQPLRPQQAAAFRHDAIRDCVYVWELAAYQSTRTFKGLLDEWAIRLVLDWTFYLGPILSLPLFAAVATAPYGFKWKQLDANTRFLLLCVPIFAASIAVEVFSYPHYAAPITCILIALVVLAMRYLRQQRYRGMPFGLFLTRAIPVLCALLLVLRAAALPLHIPMSPSVLPTMYNAVRGKNPGYTIGTRLERMPGQHLVIVHYTPGSQDWMGWVHNEADIDGAKIVWAWDMGSEKNRELVDYFNGRHIWLVNSAEDSPTISPYPKHSSP
jgi:hypothetical protein